LPFGFFLGFCRQNAARRNDTLWLTRSKNPRVISRYERHMSPTIPFPYSGSKQASRWQSLCTDARCGPRPHFVSRYSGGCGGYRVDFSARIRSNNTIDASDFPSLPLIKRSRARLNAAYATVACRFEPLVCACGRRRACRSFGDIDAIVLAGHVDACLCAAIHWQRVPVIGRRDKTISRSFLEAYRDNLDGAWRLFEKAGEWRQFRSLFEACV